MESISDYAELLGPRTTAAWPVLAEIVPDGTVLMGGTALAIRIAHRRSEDLDLFADHRFDPDPLHHSLADRGDFVLSRKSPGHLHGTFEGVKVDILWNAGAVTLAEPTIITGLAVGSLQDIMATKCRAITDRHILRDYFDVMCIEQKAGITIEEGVALYLQRYGLSPQHGSVHSLVAGLGYFDDVEDDPLLRGMIGEDVRDRVVNYFESRHPEIVQTFMQSPQPPDRG